MFAFRALLENKMMHKKSLLRKKLILHIFKKKDSVKLIIFEFMSFSCLDFLKLSGPICNLRYKILFQRFYIDIYFKF